MSFWQEKTLEEMTRDEWEAICDGCGKCCLHSFIDSDEEDESFESTDFLREGEELLYTDVVCQYNDKNSCGCSRYSERQVLVPSCVQLTKENLKDIFLCQTVVVIDDFMRAGDWQAGIHLETTVPNKP